jgi:hypothetical protein
LASDPEIGVVAVTVGVMGAAADLFSRSLPQVPEVRGQPATEAAVADVRNRCAQGAAVVLTLGGVVSMLVKSPWPAVGVAAVVAWLWWQYDTAARHDATGSTPAASASWRRFAA